MSHIPSLSLVIGGATGTGTAILQQSASPMLMPIVSAVIGAVFSYAVLKTTVQVMERDMTQMRKDMGQMHDLLREFSSRIAHIEGRLDGQ